MTNASSTYLSILIGAIIGAVISWWIYNRQKKISNKQDATLLGIQKIDERHDKMLKRIELLEQHHQKTLNAILELNKQLKRMIESGQDAGNP